MRASPVWIGLRGSAARRSYAGFTLEPIPIVGLELDLGVQQKTLEVAAQLARQEERASVATPADPLDATS